MARIETEIVVAGTGPGGATLANELARKGKDVVMVEKGPWHRYMVGSYASLAGINKFIRPKDGGLMTRGVSVGGSSVVFNGNAYEPPSWLKTELGIDLSEETAETRKELNIKPLPKKFYDKWPSTQRLVDAAADLDVALVPQYKFIDPNRCDPRCDDCMLGCRKGAKWTAREYITQAQRRGARLIYKSPVKQVIIENGEAKGIKIKSRNGIDEIRADKVVLAAGGMGTPVILLNSGITKAGEGFFIDPMNVIYARSKYPGAVKEQTFSVASEEFMETDGFMLGNLGGFPLLPSAVIGRLRRNKYSHVVGMFTKIGDSPGGRIHADGTIDKTYTKEDMERFDKSTKVSKEILIKSGAYSDSIRVAHNIGGHPGGTAAIGKIVDNDLQAFEAKNLYVCDASVFPRSPGRPPTLTIIALAKHMAKSF